MPTKPKKPPLGSDHLNRLQRKWWWWHPGAKDHWQSPGAHEWELLRRTNFYPALWEAHQRVINSLKQRAAASTERPAARDLIDLLRTSPDRAYHSILGNLVGETLQTYLLHGIDPTISWVDLSAAQRMAVRGSAPVGQRMRHPEAHEMALGLAWLHPKSPLGIAVGKTHWRGDALTISGAVDSDWFQSLPLKETTPYLVVSFMVHLPVEALERGLSERFNSLLGEKVTSSARADLASERPAEQKRLSKTAPWWRPGEISPSPRQPDPRIRVVPAARNRKAFCLIPSCDDLGVLRGRFATAIRRESRLEWEPECQRFWQANRTGTAPFAALQPPRKLATSAHLYLGLAVWDAVKQTGAKAVGNGLGPGFAFLSAKLAEAVGLVTQEGKRRDVVASLDNQSRAAGRLLAALDSLHGDPARELDTYALDSRFPFLVPSCL